ncbi:hypothetical protein BHM03_00042811 [Ensete ventricosum]|nr:hypothetical protein BHM03_00042811 [Ensete ventricosum]
MSRSLGLSPGLAFIPVGRRQAVRSMRLGVSGVAPCRAPLLEGGRHHLLGSLAEGTGRWRRFPGSRMAGTGQGSYYLNTRSGSWVGEAPSNNKGWKTRHLFISDNRAWGLRLEWLAHTMGNVPPYLFDEESEQFEQLKGILSSSRAIREVNEGSLVKAGLSSAPRETTHPSKKPKTGTQKLSQSMAAREAAKEVARAPRGEGISRMRGPRGKEPIETVGDKAAIEKVWRPNR